MTTAATASDTLFKKLLGLLKPALDASMDAVCIVDKQNRILYVNLGMKNFLGLRGTALRKQPVFCDLVKLAACEKSCQVLHTIKTGEKLRLDEAPATRGEDKHRVLLTAVPLMDIGAIITLRDTTGEVLLQAKYHKLMEMLKSRDEKIGQLNDRLNSLRDALRRARYDATSK